jgi:hypothetical protein
MCWTNHWLLYKIVLHKLYQFKIIKGKSLRTITRNYNINNSQEYNNSGWYRRDTTDLIQRCKSEPDSDCNYLLLSLEQTALLSVRLPSCLAPFQTSCLLLPTHAQLNASTLHTDLQRLSRIQVCRVCRRWRKQWPLPRGREKCPNQFIESINQGPGVKCASTSQTKR